MPRNGGRNEFVYGFAAKVVDGMFPLLKRRQDPLAETDQRGNFSDECPLRGCT